MRAHVNPVQRCYDALNRANRRDGLPPVPATLDYFYGLGSKADAGFHIFIPLDNYSLAHFLYRFRTGRIFRMSDVIQMARPGASLSGAGKAG